MKKKIIVIASLIIAAVIIIVLVSNNVTISATPVAFSTVTPASASQAPDSAGFSSPAPSVDPAASSSTTPVVTEKEPISYQNNTIIIEYRDIISDESVTEKTTVDETSSSLEAALDLIAQTFFGKPLNESPADPNSITLDGNNLYIDFKESIIDSTNWGSSVESSFLNAVANAYLTNVESVKNVYISVNGQDYSSGHIEISKSQPFTPLSY